MLVRMPLTPAAESFRGKFDLRTSVYKPSEPAFLFCVQSALRDSGLRGDGKI